MLLQKLLQTSPMDTNQPSKHNKHSVTNKSSKAPIFVKTKKHNLSYPNIHVWLLRTPREILNPTLSQILTEIQNYGKPTSTKPQKKTSLGSIKVKFFSLPIM
jgi:hypothetical protein